MATTINFYVMTLLYLVIKEKFAWVDYHVFWGGGGGGGGGPALFDNAHSKSIYIYINRWFVFYLNYVALKKLYNKG